MFGTLQFEYLSTNFVGTAEVLEEVHLASESMDYETVKKQGKVYLESTGKIVKK